MPRTKSRITPARMRKLAGELVDYLSDNGILSDVNIYVAGERWSTYEPDAGHETRTIGKSGSVMHVVPCEDIGSKIEYSNPDTITVTFEGGLYDLLNYGDGSTEEDINSIMKKYGLYMEPGYAWSFAAYEI